MRTTKQLLFLVIKTIIEAFKAEIPDNKQLVIITFCSVIVAYVFYQLIFI